MTESDSVRRTQQYYDSDAADHFYAAIWGDEHLHVGIFKDEHDSLASANIRTIAMMTSLLPAIDESTRIADIGSGTGGTARHLAAKYGCHVDCLNLSERQNEKNRVLTSQAGLDRLVRVIGGNFEALPFDSGTYEVVWSQDAMLHSNNRRKVVSEARRVLATGGQFVFTDLLRSEACPDETIKPILNRLHLDSMGTRRSYEMFGREAGFAELAFVDLSEHLALTYSHALAQLENRSEELLPFCGLDFIDHMKTGLRHWIEGGKSSYLEWGIFNFKS